MICNEIEFPHKYTHTHTLTHIHAHIQARPRTYKYITLYVYDQLWIGSGIKTQKVYNTKLNSVIQQRSTNLNNKRVIKIYVDWNAQQNEASMVSKTKYLCIAQV